MRIFYKVHLTGNHEDSDIISIGLAADNGVSLYAEINDYDEAKVDQAADEAIVSQLLGREGMEELIANKKKVKGSIAPLFRVTEYINMFLSPFKYIKLIGHANYAELYKALSLLNKENFSKEVSFINLEDDLVEANMDIQDNVLEYLPEGNALKVATWYKHIAIRHSNQGQKLNP